MMWFVQPLRLVLLLCLMLLSGCESVSYYSQAAAGQLSLVWQRKSIEQIINHSDVDAGKGQRLQLVLAIRQFASDELGLPDNKSYSSYVELDRPHVVWNVFVAEEFSVTPQQWCFPIAGCVHYRGYFSQVAAEKFAEKMRHKGFETHVAGVSAYSTLGWFNDPVLSTFLDYDEPYLAGLLFHELAHQLIYIPGDTAFNESFATAVEYEGIRRWMQQQRKTDALDRYFYHERMQRDFVAVLLDLREQLDQQYRKDIPDPLKKAYKQQTIEHFKHETYPQFKARWQHSERYDRWVEQEINNARLIPVASYHQWLAAFEQLLRQSNNDLPAFYQQVKSLTDMTEKQRHELLSSLSGSQ